MIIEGLFTCVTNVNFNAKTVEDMISAVREEKNRVVPNCRDCASSCGNTDDFDMENIWNDNEDIRSLKSLILFGIRGMAAYAYHAMVLGYEDEAVNQFFYKALCAISYEMEMGDLLPIVLEVGEVNLKCMALLDQANTTTYGTPVPTKVSLNIEKGPFIVFFFSGFSCLVSLPYLFLHYHPMSPSQLGFLLLAGLAASGGQFSITAAYCNAPAREISVCDYSQIIFSALLGFLLFSQVPDFLSVIGYLTICVMAVVMFLYNNRKTC